MSRDLNHSLHATQDWIGDLARRLRWHDREQVYQVLMAALHALRDCLDRDQAVYMGAQLPAVLRGFYYEGWRPGRRALIRNRNSFLDRVHDGVHRNPAVDPEEVARSVLAQFADRLRAVGVEDPKASIPGVLQNIWPA
ncbi:MULTISPECIES: DUF2267 domain-containing protein [Mesorhizobium]|nr:MULTISPECIES: DUF2267 domain-containing protein [Mesorhizobium]